MLSKKLMLEVLNEALEAGIIKDYYISRCGDDIDLIMIPPYKFPAIIA